MKDSSDRGLGEGEGLENGLPQPFVESMRTLFDILDDQHTGRVKFSDIERRWHEDEDCGSSGLPAGVLDSLRVVTPLDGYLSFSRFCKGLQICLLRSKSGNLSLMPQMSSSNSNSLESNKSSRRSSGQARVHAKDDDVPPPLPPPPPPLRDSSPPPLPYHSHPNNNNTHSKKSSTAANSLNSYDHQKQQAITSSRQNPGSHQPPNNPRNPPWASQGGTGRSRQPLPPAQGTSNSITSSSNRASDAFKLDQFIQHASHRSALYNDAANSYQKNSLPDAAPDGAIIYQRSGSSEKPSRYDASASVDHYNNSNNINIAAAQCRVNQYINSGGGTAKLPSPRKSSSSKNIRPSLSSEDILRDASVDPAVPSPSYVRGGGTHHHKTDIRMGTAGMMSLYSTKMSSTSSSQHGEQGHSTGPKAGPGVSGPTEGPPKPPRALESQNSDGNLNSGSERKVNNTNSNSGDGTSNHGVSSVAHRVDSLINKMEALSSTYGTAASSKNYASNVKQDKIYDRVAKNRPSSSGNSLGSAGKSLSGGNLSNGDRNLPPTSFSSNHHSSNSTSGSKFNSNSGAAPAGGHFSGLQGGSSFAPPPPVRGGGMGGRAPATLPLSALNGYSLQRSQTHSHITTHSLERDSRTDARRPPPETMSSKTRTRRGGSLERLLDGHQHHNAIGNSNGVVGGLPALPSYSHYHPHYNHHHHHSRESSNDTTSTAPAFPYHWNTDWNSATNGQQQRGQSKQQQHISYAAAPHGKPGYQVAGGSKPYGGKNQSDDGQQQSSSNENSPRRSSTALPSHAAAADHRLTMSSYAWIRGGDDSSGSDVNTNTNTDHHHHHFRHSTATGFTVPATAVTYAASSAHTATVTPTAALASASSAAASGSDVDAAGGGAGGGVVMRGHRKGRRREARRHTLQNGLDYAAVRRAGELEAERDMLHQGLQVVEQARQWYRSQLHRLLASLHNPSDPTQQPYDSEAQQQKLHYQLARITEINTQLSALMNASQMPHHLALATTITAAPPGVAGGEGAEEDKAKMEGQVKRLRNQNQQLTEEVSQKSQHISALEQDKSRLLQELFQARAVSASMQAGGQADSTFM